MKLTEADFQSWKFRNNDIHFHGDGMFGYGHPCIDQPRLVVIDTSYRKTRSTVRSYTIDGRTKCETLAEALELLSSPPVLTEEDRTLLATVSDDWHRRENRFEVYSLTKMGFVEMQRREENRFMIRRTDAGRAALAREAEGGK